MEFLSNPLENLKDKAIAQAQILMQSPIVVGAIALVLICAYFFRDKLGIKPDHKEEISNETKKQDADSST
ncbi:MAG: hypothetical protein RLN81_12670 [Balneolaceae bacterium]